MSWFVPGRPARFGGRRVGDRSTRAAADLGRSTQGGVFTISLDFELFWGMSDIRTLDDDYRALLERTREVAIPRLLDTFAAHGLHATWATVGMLFFDRSDDLLAACPEIRPDYDDPGLSRYAHLPRPGVDESGDPYRLGASLVRRILETPHQEIGCHSFSHFYCLEPNSRPDSFRADLEAWRSAAAAHGVGPGSICFGRNQYDDAALAACGEVGFRAYRGNERAWFWKPAAGHGQSLARKVARYLDSYVPLSRPTCPTLAEVDDGTVHNVAASRFLRAHRPRLRRIEPLQRRRIVRMMEYAARRNRVFHLWWHPQDFAEHTDENFAVLDRIAATFVRLRDEYGMAAMTMGEVAELSERSVGDRHAARPTDPVETGAPAA